MCITVLPWNFQKIALAFGGLQQDCLNPFSDVSQKMFFYVLLAREIHLKLNMPYREICICNCLSSTFSERKKQ